MERQSIHFILLLFSNTFIFFLGFIVTFVFVYVRRRSGGVGVNRGLKANSSLK